MSHVRNTEVIVLSGSRELVQAAMGAGEGQLPRALAESDQRRIADVGSASASAR